MSKFPLLSRPQQRKTMTPAALAANKANAQKAGRPKGKISLSDISFRDRCRVRDEEHIVSGRVTRSRSAYPRSHAQQMLSQLADAGRRSSSTRIGGVLSYQHPLLVKYLLSKQINTLPLAVSSCATARATRTRDRSSARAFESYKAWRSVMTPRPQPPVTP